MVESQSLRILAFCAVVCVASAAQESKATPDSNAQCQLCILSDTKNVDFGPYLKIFLNHVREEWYSAIPLAAKPPLTKQGAVTIRFSILKNGKIDSMLISGPSGDVSLDRAAWEALKRTSRLKKLPKEFTGEKVDLSFRFTYNPTDNAQK